MTYIDSLMKWKVRITRALSYITYINTVLIMFISLKQIPYFDSVPTTVLFMVIIPFFACLLFFIGWLEYKIGMHKAELQYTNSQNKIILTMQQQLNDIKKILEEKKQ